jgi:O-succinylbenzoate synthase
VTPPLDDLLDRLHVVALPMRVRFRGIMTREVALIEGPAGWGEFSAFLEYEPAEAAAWLASAVEAAYQPPPVVNRDRIPINATVPAVPALEVPEVLARFPGVQTAKVKVAEPGQTLTNDVDRVEVVRALVPNVRVDANGAWTVDEAVTAIQALSETGSLQYVEQPCQTVDELAEVRRRVDVPIAADESIRKADDPLRVVRAGAADVAVLKVAPLGGVHACLRIAEQIGLPVVVSSAVETSIGLAAGLALAAALPELPYACGLATTSLLAGDVVAAPLRPVDGFLPVGRQELDPAAYDAVAADGETDARWQARLSAVRAVLA